MKPKVDISTFGGVNREEVEKRIGGRFGIEEKPSRKIKLPSMERSMPKKTEEPSAETKRLSDGVAVDIHMPEVRGIEDIDIKELGSSVEVRAIAGDKAYFKILTKPENFHVKRTDFSDGTLRLEFS